MDSFEILSIWHVVRLTGLVSLVLLLMSIFCGALLHFLPPKRKALSMFIHQFAGWVGLGLGFIHGLLLHFSTYKPYTLKEIFIPFVANNQPFLSGLGTIGLWLFAFIIFSSDFRSLFKQAIWKGAHFLSMPLFVILAIHGIFQGTDRNEMWFIIFFTILLSIFWVIFFVRFFIARENQKVRKVKV